MERKEKGKVNEKEEEIQEVEEEEMAKKLRRGLLMVNGVDNRRAGPSTPSPTWKLDFLPLSSSSSSSSQPSLIKTVTADHKPVSARKLCANLWEIEQFPVPKIRRELGKRNQDKDKPQTPDVDHGDGPPDPNQPLSRISLRRQMAASMLPHHKSVERKGPSLQLGSPANYNDSVKIEPFKMPTSPTSSLDSRNRNGEPSRSLKTSPELLKFLNRICRLENKHESNIALVKALKEELAHCRTEIRDLQHGKISGNEGIGDGFRNHAGENKIPRRKNKEQEWLKAALQSVGDELRDERELRKRSESLHRKVARELSEMKYALTEALKELDGERNARVVLENLCDEFAKAVKQYDQEVRLLKGKSLKERQNRDPLILRISEAWLNERLQIKMVQDKDDLAEKKIVVDKLGRDIETLLQLNQSTGSRNRRPYFSDEAKNTSHQRSMESYPLNYEGVSAENCGSDSEYHEPGRSGSRNGRKASYKEKYVEKELANSSNSVKQRIRSRKLEKDETLCNLQEQLDRKDDKLQVDGNGMKNKWVDRSIRNRSLSSEGDKIHPEGNLREDENVDESSSLACPCPTGLETSGSCSKFPTLQAKLIEARLESRLSRSRTSRASL